MNKEIKSVQAWPQFSEEEIMISSEILRSGKVNYWTGDHGKLFEEEFSEYLGVNYSIALANGTLAIDLALKCLGVGPGDEVIVTPRSFIASVSCVVNAGAVPVFADVDPLSGNIDPSYISDVITSKTKAIICVHLAGWPCNMDEIMDLATRHELFVIEDCAQAHGASYKGKKVGSLGHIAAWSFCQDKIMSTGGEGGMVTTDDKDLWSKMWSYKDHGKNYDSVYSQSTLPGFKWLHDSFGSNFRMTEFQSAIGRIQLKKLDDWSKIRNNNANFMKKLCDSFDNVLKTPICDEDYHHAYYKFYTYIDIDKLKDGVTRDSLIEILNLHGVPAFSGSCPEIYLENAFKNTSFAPDQRLPQARLLGETSLMFPVHPTLLKEDLEYISKGLKNAFNEVIK